MKRTSMWDYAMVIGSAFIATLMLKFAFVEAYKVPSESMIPTLLVGDDLLANKLVYGIKIPFFNRKILILTSPHKGDIIVFRSPEDPRKELIKRVVAVEGDLIEGRNKQIFINGMASNEPYVQHTDNFLEDPRDDFGPYVIPKDKLFVMGDNRDESYDSRFYGFVDLKDVEGKAFVVYWSWDNETTLPRFNRIGLNVK